MSKTSGKHDEAELAALRERCSAIIEFLAKCAPGAEAVFAAAEAGVKNAFERGDLQGMRMAARDLCEWTDSLSPDERLELESFLGPRLAAGMTSAREELEDRIESVLRRGEIADKEEYRLVQSHVENIHADGGPRLEKLNRLLVDYDVTVRGSKRLGS